MTTPTGPLKGTWRKSADVVTLTGTGQAGKGYVWTVHQSGRNLGSKAHPGEITADGRPWVRWEAVRN